MNTYRLIGAWLLVLIFAESSYTQTIPAGKASDTQWLLNFQAGSDPGLNLPSVAFGVSFEHEITTRLELQGGVAYSPTKTSTTNDGHSLAINSEGVFWISRRLAATASLHRATLSSSQLNHSTWSPQIGFAIREHTFGSSGRFYLSYLIPVGCQWGVNCPIQSVRETGPRINWEHRILTHWRVGFEFGVYRVLNQGNPQDPAAGRTSQVTGDAHIISRFEFPGGRIDEDY
jgi:hypothetical protein